MTMTYVGIDVSKATFVVAYSSAKSSETKTFKNTTIIAKTICTNFQNEMCKNRHFFAVCLPVLEYHSKGF